MVPTCVNCGCELGVKPGSDSPGEMPFHVRDDDGTGVGRNESWCPYCFVTHRAPLEPERFHPYRSHIGQGGYRAVKCLSGRCGVISVSGDGNCTHCNFRVTIPAPVKLDTGTMGWDPDVLKKSGLVQVIPK